MGGWYPLFLNSGRSPGFVQVPWYGRRFAFISVCACPGIWRPRQPTGVLCLLCVTVHVLYAFVLWVCGMCMCCAVHVYLYILYLSVGRPCQPGTYKIILQVLEAAIESSCFVAIGVSGLYRNSHMRCASFPSRCMRVVCSGSERYGGTSLAGWSGS